MLPSRHVPAAARAAYRLDRKASLLAGLYTGAIFPFIGIIARETLHASELELSILSAAPFLGSLLAIFYAHAVEGRRKVRSMVGPFILCRVILFCVAFAHGSLAFVLLVGLAQLVAGVAGPATAAVLKEIYPDDSRGRIMSYNRVALTVTSALIALPAGWLLKQVGYQLLFPVAAVVGMVGSLTYLRIENLYADRWPPPPPALPLRQRLAPRTAWRALGESLTFLRSTFQILRDDKSYRWFALSVFTYGFGNLMVLPLYPIFQVDRLHVSTPQMGWLAQISQVTMILAYFYWGRYVDLLSPLRAVALNVLLNACIPLLYFFSSEAWHLIPAFVLTGITNAGIDLAYFNSILAFANEQTVARYQALHSFLLGIRGTVAPFAGAALMRAMGAHGIDVKYLFLVSMALILLGCWMQAAGVKAQPPRNTSGNGEGAARRQGIRRRPAKRTVK
ncbi:MAG: MFS transporter [Armatimonadetes bacterium]|jgi:MFS family permease|nr:MFS transporter [Armatimonadota bacterium]